MEALLPPPETCRVELRLKQIEADPRIFFRPQVSGRHHAVPQAAVASVAVVGALGALTTRGSAEAAYLGPSSSKPCLPVDSLSFVPSGGIQ